MLSDNTLPTKIVIHIGRKTTESTDKKFDFPLNNNEGKEYHIFEKTGWSNFTNHA